jgi:hypothetical protein
MGKRCRVWLEMAMVTDLVEDFAGFKGQAIASGHAPRQRKVPSNKRR